MGPRSKGVAMGSVGVAWVDGRAPNAQQWWEVVVVVVVRFQELYLLGISEVSNAAGVDRKAHHFSKYLTF